MNVHGRPENAGGHGQAARAEGVNETVEQLGRAIGRLGVVETRPPSFGRRPGQGELRDGQDLPARVDHGQVHLVLGVGKNAQFRRFAGERFSVRFAVTLDDADEKTKAAADPPGHAAVDFDSGLANALEHDFHQGNSFDFKNVDKTVALFYHNALSKETLMLKHPSAERQNRRSIRHRKINKKNASTLRTEIKKVRALIENKDQEAAKKALPRAYAVIDKTVKKGTIHSNTGARYKSRLAAQVGTIKPASSK